MSIEKKYNILCATDDKYVPYCGIMLTSLFENNINCQINVYLLTEELNLSNRSILKELSLKYNQEINIVIVDGEKLNGCPIKPEDHVSLATYYRLLAPILVQQDIDRILYLDCDMVVNDSIEELYNIELKDTAVAAVLDEDYITREKYKRLDYPEEKKYFNAGMLLINLSYWRKNRVMERCFDYIHNNPERITFHDQDTLNYVLQDEKILISTRNNLQTGFLYIHNKYELKMMNEIIDSIKSPMIIHYTGPNKPWRKGSRHPFCKKFLYYKKISLWSDHPLINARRNWKEKLIKVINSIIWATGLKKRPQTYIIDTQD